MSASDDNRLTILAADIRAAHEAIQASAIQMAEHALAAGHALIEAKALLPHGAWTDWLRANAGMSERSARRYMQIAKAGMKTATVAGLGIRAAAEALARQREQAIEPSHEKDRATYNAAALITNFMPKDKLPCLLTRLDEAGHRKLVSSIRVAIESDELMSAWNEAAPRAREEFLRKIEAE